MFIPDEVLKEIKDKLDIVDVVRDYVHSLKKVGKNWVSLCPFHNDHNPSMRVSQEIGIFKCFSCGEGGDIFGFIQKIENISFVESVKLLAKKAGIELNLQTDELSKNYQQREELLQFNIRLVKLFQHFLVERKEGASALKYLINRGINQELIDIFKIGYVPGDFHKILSVFYKKGFNEDFLLTTGIVNKGERGLKPLFFDRVIFPVFNQNNECIGFGGRALSNDVMPKYINSPETMLYKKNKSLYGINIAKKYIREKKRVYLVEGYMDVITCYKNGVNNVVAPCGTAVTSGQIALLNRYAEELVLFLDSDNAGIKGTERALKETSNTLLKKYVLLLENEKDPDEYFKNHTIEDFRKLENNLMDGFDFLVKAKTEKIDKKDYTVLVNALNSIFEYIAIEENEIIQNSLIERLSGILNIDKRSVAREYLSYKNKNRYKVYKEETIENRSNDGLLNNNIKSVFNNNIKKEIDLIIDLLFLEESLDLIKKAFLKEEHFSIDLTKRLFTKIFRENLSINKKNFIDLVDDNDIKKYIETRLLSDDFKDISGKENELYNDAVDRIRDIEKIYYENQKAVINKNIKFGELYQDEEYVRKFQEEKSVIIKEITKLSKLQELKK